MTIQYVANELGVSTKTLRRWNEDGRFVPTRNGDGSMRLYDPHQVGYMKKILELDRHMKQHLKLLDGLRKQLDKHNLEQDYKPGQPLKLFDAESASEFFKASDAMEKWNLEYKRLLNEILKYPEQMIKATIDNYEDGEK